MRSVYKFAKPIVVVSKCLAMGRCRWDGDILKSELTKRLKSYIRFIPICPEMEIGLGIPRDPIHLSIDRRGNTLLYQPSTNHNLNGLMNKFSKQFVENLKDVDGFILKAKSPSCGIKTVKLYDSKKEKRKTIGRVSGLFASTILKQFPALPIEDEKSLAYPENMDRWLTRLYTIADLRKLKKRLSAARLIGFHARHKLLVQAYSVSASKRLDNLLIGLNSGLKLESIFSRYEYELKRAIMGRMRKNNVKRIFFNTLVHFSEHLPKAEQKEFKKLLNNFDNKRYNIPEIRKHVNIWGVRYDKSYLREHSFFRPYPSVLLDC